MLFRNKNGILVDIVRANYATDSAYYTAVINCQSTRPAFFCPITAETQIKNEQDRLKALTSLKKNRVGNVGN